MKRALAYSVNYVTVDKRNTLLRDRLRELLPLYEAKREDVKIVRLKTGGAVKAALYDIESERREDRIVAEAPEYGVYIGRET